MGWKQDSRLLSEAQALLFPGMKARRGEAGKTPRQPVGRPDTSRTQRAFQEPTPSTEPEPASTLDYTGPPPAQKTRPYKSREKSEKGALEKGLKEIGGGTKYTYIGLPGTDLGNGYFLRFGKRAVRTVFRKRGSTGISDSPVDDERYYGKFTSADLDDRIAFLRRGAAKLARLAATEKKPTRKATNPEARKIFARDASKVFGVSDPDKAHDIAIVVGSAIQYKAAARKPEAMRSTGITADEYDAALTAATKAGLAKMRGNGIVAFARKDLARMRDYFEKNFGPGSGWSPLRSLWKHPEYKGRF